MRAPMVRKGIGRARRVTRSVRLMPVHLAYNKVYRVFAAVSMQRISSPVSG